MVGGSTEICDPQGRSSAGDFELGKVTGGATGTGPAAITQCTGGERHVIWQLRALHENGKMWTAGRQSVAGRWGQVLSGNVEAAHGSRVRGGHLEEVVKLLADGNWFMVV